MPINKTATLCQQLYALLEGTEVLAHRNVGHCFGLYVGANNQNTLKAFALGQRVQSLLEQSPDFLHQLALDLTTPIQCDDTLCNFPFAMSYNHRKISYGLQQYT